MAKIALQFYFHIMEQPENWPKVLLHIQLLVNNTVSTTTTKTSNKIALGITLNQPLDLLADSIGLNHEIVQVEVKDAISFAQVNFKHHYDWSHQLMNLSVNKFAPL